MSDINLENESTQVLTAEKLFYYYSKLAISQSCSVLRIIHDDLAHLTAQLDSVAISELISRFKALVHYKPEILSTGRSEFKTQITDLVLGLLTSSIKTWDNRNVSYILRYIITPLVDLSFCDLQFHTYLTLSLSQPLADITICASFTYGQLDQDSVDGILEHCDDNYSPYEQSKQINYVTNTDQDENSSPSVTNSSIPSRLSINKPKSYIDPQSRRYMRLKTLYGDPPPAFTSFDIITRRRAAYILLSYISTTHMYYYTQYAPTPQPSTILPSSSNVHPPSSVFDLYRSDTQRIQYSSSSTSSSSSSSSHISSLSSSTSSCFPFELVQQLRRFLLNNVELFATEVALCGDFYFQNILFNIILHTINLFYLGTSGPYRQLVSYIAHKIAFRICSAQLFLRTIILSAQTGCVPPRLLHKTSIKYPFLVNSDNAHDTNISVHTPITGINESIDVGLLSQSWQKCGHLYILRVNDAVYTIPSLGHTKPILSLTIDLKQKSRQPFRSLVDDAISLGKLSSSQCLDSGPSSFQSFYPLYTQHKDLIPSTYTSIVTQLTSFCTSLPLPVLSSTPSRDYTNDIKLISRLMYNTTLDMLLPINNESGTNLVSVHHIKSQGLYTNNCRKHDYMTQSSWFAISLGSCKCVVIQELVPPSDDPPSDDPPSDDEAWYPYYTLSFENDLNKLSSLYISPSSDIQDKQPHLNAKFEKRFRILNYHPSLYEFDTLLSEINQSLIQDHIVTKNPHFTPNILSSLSSIFTISEPLQSALQTALIASQNILTIQIPILTENQRCLFHEYKLDQMGTFCRRYCEYVQYTPTKGPQNYLVCSFASIPSTEDEIKLLGETLFATYAEYDSPDARPSIDQYGQYLLDTFLQGDLVLYSNKVREDNIKALDMMMATSSPLAHLTVSDTVPAYDDRVSIITDSSDSTHNGIYNRDTLNSQPSSDDPSLAPSRGSTQVATAAAVHTDLPQPQPHHRPDHQDTSHPPPFHPIVANKPPSSIDILRRKAIPNVKPIALSKRLNSLYPASSLAPDIKRARQEVPNNSATGPSDHSSGGHALPLTSTTTPQPSTPYHNIISNAKSTFPTPQSVTPGRLQDNQRTIAQTIKDCSLSASDLVSKLTEVMQSSLSQHDIDLCLPQILNLFQESVNYTDLINLLHQRESTLLLQLKKITNSDQRKSYMLEQISSLLSKNLLESDSLINNQCNDPHNDSHLSTETTPHDLPSSHSITTYPSSFVDQCHSSQQNEAPMNDSEDEDEDEEMRHSQLYESVVIPSSLPTPPFQSNGPINLFDFKTSRRDVAPPSHNDQPPLVDDDQTVSPSNLQDSDQNIHDEPKQDENDDMMDQLHDMDQSLRDIAESTGISMDGPPKPPYIAILDYNILRDLTKRISYDIDLSFITSILKFRDARDLLIEQFFPRQAQQIKDALNSAPRSSATTLAISNVVRKFHEKRQSQSRDL